jgi:hypothetical protein
LWSARKAGFNAYGSDIKPQNGLLGVDHIFPWDFLKTETTCDWTIVSNPPFGKAEEFAKLALGIAKQLALLLPVNWVQGDKRSRWLETTPLRRVLFITPRPSMPPGAIVLAGKKPGNGTTDYAWFIWDQDYEEKPEIGWCRK